MRRAIPIPIPSDVNLIGQGVHAQAAIVDANGAFAGSLDFSEAIELVVGKPSGT